MQNQNMQPWAWGQASAPSFPAGSVFPSTFSTAAMDQSQLMSGYQQMYGAPPTQPPPDYGASQWSAAQIQQWQQWQQWQEKYQQWQAQYGKKYAESIAAMGQNPGLVLPGIPSVPAVMKPNESVSSSGYTTANPPPPPSNAQPVPPPPPEEDKPTGKERTDGKGSESEGVKESAEELSEAEKTFDIQFKQWEDQFNEWKKQNQDHPDRVQYREYEKKWETWREQLLQRREQMRKKRISRAADSSGDGNNLGKNEESKVKVDQGQVKIETSSSYRSFESQNTELKSSISFSSHDTQGVFPQGKPQEGMSAPGNFGFPNVDAGFSNLPAYFDKETPNFVGQGPPSFAPGPLDNKFRMEGVRDNQGGPRFDLNRNDYPPRRPFGNGSVDENFGPRFGGFDIRKPIQDRFGDGRLKDAKYNPPGRDFGPPGQLDASFKRTFPGDGKQPFMKNLAKNNLNNSFSRPKVPSLFDITVERPPGLRSPGKDRKPKIWEQDKDNYFDGPFDEKKDEKNPRNDGPWLSNVAWASNNSPWIKPWELDRVVGEKPPDAHLRPDAWQESISGKRSDDNSWGADGRKPEMDKSELSGYVGKILAKLGNFNVIPPNVPGKDSNLPPGYVSDNTRKNEDNSDGKPFQGATWPGKNDQQGRHPFGQDGGPDGGPKGDREEMLFGRGDCDDRVRFERDRPNFPRSFASESFRRDEREAFPESGRNAAADENRFFAKSDRPGGKFVDDIDERLLRNRDRNGRRGFEDREDRLFRGMYDRDDRRTRNFANPFDRFGRGCDSTAKELEWKPQVFDYSSGNQTNFRPRFDADDNFHIPTVVDYSHGENKQTFDYGHGEGKNENLPIRSFDYGHGRESPAVIDYGHGSDRDVGLQKWKKESQDKSNELDRQRSKSKSPQRRSRSPRGRFRSRSRSPHSGGRGRRESNSPPFRGHRSRSRDRFNRQTVKRNRRNNSEDKAMQSSDGDTSKNSFDVTTVLVEDLICSPGRESRPNKLVFIMRGLPGSGKTYVTKLIKDKEVELGGDAPRILSLDDYFMTEVEKEVVDDETGRKMKKKVLEYEYESGVEPHYRGSLLKAFKKTISDGFFSFIIVDSVNEKTKDYEEMWSFAKQKGFQVYVAEMDDDVAVCTKRNIHKRTEKEISDLAKAWEKTPNHYLRLDVRSLLQADAITEVEMEVVSDTDLDKIVDLDKDDEKDAEEAKDDEDEDEPGESAFVKSRWDHFENSEQKLDRLDGLKRRREGFHATMEDYLQLPDDFELGSSEPTDGKKKVRWADLEERRQQEKMRAIGFVVGQTDWSRMTDPTFGESALTRTKYI